MAGSTSEQAPPDTPAADGTGYMYQAYVCAHAGWWNHWRGRVITCDEGGRYRYWPWRYTRDRDRLVRLLQNEIYRDIRWRHGGAEVRFGEAPLCRDAAGDTPGRGAQVG